MKKIENCKIIPLCSYFMNTDHEDNYFDFISINYCSDKNITTRTGDEFSVYLPYTTHIITHINDTCINSPHASISTLK